MKHLLSFKRMHTRHSMLMISMGRRFMYEKGKGKFE